MESVIILLFYFLNRKNTTALIDNIYIYIASLEEGAQKC